MNQHESLAVIDVRENIEVRDQVQLISTAIINGDVNPAKAGVFLKRMEKIAKDVFENKEVKTIIEEDTIKYITGTKEKIFGASISHCAIYTGYDFKNCGDPELDSLYDIQEIIKAKIKDKEETLKLIIPKEKQGANFGIESSNRNMLIEQTWKLEKINSGEVLEIRPPVKFQKMGLKYMKL